MPLRVTHQQWYIVRTAIAFIALLKRCCSGRVCLQRQEHQIVKGSKVIFRFGSFSGEVDRFGVNDGRGIGAGSRETFFALGHGVKGSCQLSRLLASNDSSIGPRWAAESICHHRGRWVQDRHAAVRQKGLGRHADRGSLTPLNFSDKKLTKMQTQTCLKG